MDINEHLAVKVMGWGPPKSDKPYPYDVDYYPSSPVPRMLVVEWEPDKNIEQAIMAAGKTGKHWILEQTEEGEFFSSIKNPSRREYLGMASSRTSAAEALSLALCRATGLEE